MIFVFDLDGTICYRGQPLSDNIVQRLDRLAQAGHELVFASARPIRDLLPILPDKYHRASLIGGNGGFVHRAGQPVAITHFDKSVADGLLQLMAEFEARMLIDSDWDYCYTGDDAHPIRRNLDPAGSAKNLTIDKLTLIVKIVVLQSKDFELLSAKLAEWPVVISTHGNEQILDISPVGIDKWSGLQKLGIAAGGYVAFGNDANDIPMFRQACYSVCVGEHADLQALATESVASEEEAVVSKLDEMIDRYCHTVQGQDDGNDGR